MFKRLVSAASVLALGVTAPALAQNPRGSATTSVSGKSVSVDYGRPALKGRSLETLMKDLPADRMWRAGENQVTTISLDGEVMIGDKKVPAGKYSVYVHAGEDKKWDLVLNKDLGIALGKIWDKAPENMKNEPWPYLGDYSEKIADKEVARIPMHAAKAEAAADLFTISFAPAAKGSTMTLAWGDQAWTTDVQPAK